MYNLSLAVLIEGAYFNAASAAFTVKRYSLFTEFLQQEHAPVPTQGCHPLLT